MSITLWDLRAASVERCEEVFHPVEDWSPTDWACAAAGEMGEVCKLIKKMRRGEVIPRTEVAHEIADTIIYLDLLAAALNIDLNRAVVEKFNVVSERRGSKVRL